MRAVDATGGLGWPEPPSTGLLERLLLERKVVQLGRSRSCDLVLTDDTVSRHHAMIRREPDRIVLTDLGSTNGTCVNGRWVAQAEVHSGDRVTLGGFELQL